MVERRFAWVTAGLIAPGVQWRSGSENRTDPRAWQERGAGCGWMMSDLAMLIGRPERPAGGEPAAREGGPKEPTTTTEQPRITPTVIASREACAAVSGFRLRFTSDEAIRRSGDPITIEQSGGMAPPRRARPAQVAVR
jgi:hypothetical protein